MDCFKFVSSYDSRAVGPIRVHDTADPAHLMAGTLSSSLLLERLASTDA
jgi:hypothetical protein